MNHQSIEKRLTDSMIPRHTFTTTLALANFTVLADITANRKFINPDNGTRRSYYLESPATTSSLRKASTAAALLAKELCLSREPVCYVPVSIFMRELIASLLPRETTSLSPVMSAIGKGYIVLPDFMGILGMSELYSLRELREFTDILVQHLNLGGALVMSGPKFEDKPSLAMGHSLLSAMEEHFTTIQVR